MPWVYGLKIAKRPAMAKALIINAFALAGRIGICDTFTQGVALGYGLLPPSGRTAVNFAHPPPTFWTSLKTIRITPYFG